MTDPHPAPRASHPAPRASQFDVVGVGANSIDFVCRLPVYPKPSGPHSKLNVSSYERSPGGQAATVLSACASLGLRTSYVGTIARDENGTLILDALKRRGVDTSRAILRDGANPFAVILVADEAAVHGERIVLWKRPDEMRLTPADLPAGVAGGARFVFVDDVDIDASIAAGNAAIAAGIPVTTDIEAVKPRTDELIAAVTVPIFAETVPRALTGEADPEQALRRLRNRHAGLLCVTLGAKGAAALDGDRYVYQPGFAVDAVDTTGAGDVFRAGFIYATLRGDAPADVLRFACAAAAVSCTRRGAMNAVPSLDDVQALLAVAAR
ncbi:MAG TPA: PfkB family carbohydrate kinase [Vicinamibacterales bacterium]